MTSQAITPPISICKYPSSTVLSLFSVTEEIHRGYIAEAVEYINKNYSKDISLNEITKKAYLSKFHFSRIFKKYTSYSPYQYLTAVRLNHCRQLLLNNNYSISEVADRCGFKRLDYFSAMFKKKFKYSPSVYRETYTTDIDSTQLSGCL